MTSQATTLRETMAAKMTVMKPLAMWLGIGLIAGPILSGILGFQVRTSTAQAAARAGIVEQQAAFCNERARASEPAPAALDWQRRNDLARRFATMPGATTTDPDVVYACSNRLSS